MPPTHHLYVTKEEKKGKLRLKECFFKSLIEEVGKGLIRQNR